MRPDLNLQLNTHTHTQATRTHIEVERDEVLSLDAGVVLVVDPDELPFIAQPSLITLAQLRLSLLCIAQCMFRIKTSALQLSIITPNVQLSPWRCLIHKLVFSTG